MRLLKSLSLYTLINFLGAGVNFFLMPVLSHYLSPADYGITSIINTFVTLLYPIVGFLAFGIITVDYYKIKDPKEFASLFSSLQVIPVIPALTLAVIGFLLYGSISPLLELPAKDTWVVPVIFLLSICTIYIETGNAYLIIARKAKLYAIFTVLRLVTETTLSLYFVVHLKQGWEGRIFSWLITSVVFAVVYFIYFYNEGLLTLRIKKIYIVQSLAYGIPLIPHAIGKFVINQSDRLFIAKMISIDEAGIYNVGYTVGMVFMIFANSLSNVFTPFVMERLSDLDEQKKMELTKMSYNFILALIGALIALNLFAPVFFRLVDHRYNSGLSYVFWVSLGYFFWGCYLLFAGYIFFYRKNKILAILSIVNVVTNIAFNYYFIKLFGGIGAAYATALSFFIILMAVIVQSNRLVHLPWLIGFKSLNRVTKKLFNVQ